MNSIRMAFWVAAALLAAPLALGAQQGSIYSWTDENGVKHFSDRAPVEDKADLEQIAVPDYPPPADGASPDSDPEDGSAADVAESSVEATAEELSYADQQRLAIREKREAEREKQAERKRICLRATDQLARLEPSRRVFYSDDDGNTSRLDDEERVRIVEENKKLVAQNCD